MEAQTKLELFNKPRKVKMAIDPDTWEDYQKLIDDTKFSVYGVGYFPSKQEAKRFLVREYLHDKITLKVFRKFYKKVCEKRI